MVVSLTLLVLLSIYKAIAEETTLNKEAMIIFALRQIKVTSGHKYIETVGSWVRLSNEIREYNRIILLY